MSSSSLPASHIKQYQANCRALGKVDSNLAGQLESHPIGSGVTAATGRDGTATLKVTATDGTWQWFGDSSMPGISARALFGHYGSTGGNVLLPGVGTGREALVLAGRLPPHCAVLIYEADPVAIRLALGLHDYVDLIGGRRLVFCTGPELGQALADLFVAVPGLEFPQQLLPLPGHDAATVQQLRLIVEAAGQKVKAHQAALAAAATQRLAQHRPDPAGDRPRLAVISRDPRPQTSVLVNRIVETLRHQGRPAAGCTPYRPDNCHAVALLDLLAGHRPDGVLLINCLPGPLATCLPKHLPVCSWIMTADSIPSQCAENDETSRPIFAAGGRLVKALIGAGADREQVHLLEPATDPRVFKPVSLDEGQRRRFGCDVAIWADALETTAEAANITLTSHVHLWKQLVKQVADRIGDWKTDSPRRVLQQAQRTCRVELADREFAGRFEMLVAQRLAPTMAARFVADSLSRAGLKVTIWGRGWSDKIPTGVKAGGPLEGADDVNLAYNGATVTLQPLFDGRSVQTVLDCLATGGCPVCPVPHGSWKVEHPDLAPLLSKIPQGTTPKQLVDLAKRLAGDETTRGQAVEPSIRQVLEAHTLEHRLDTLWRITLAQPASADLAATT